MTSFLFSRNTKKKIKLSAFAVLNMKQMVEEFASAGFSTFSQRNGLGWNLQLTASLGERPKIPKQGNPPPRLWI